MGLFNNVGLSAHYRLTGSDSKLRSISNLRDLIFAATGDVIRKHRILSAIPVNEGAPDTYFASLPSVDLNRSITFLKRSQPLATAGNGDDKELDSILEDQHNTNFKSEYGTLPFWRLIILQNPGLGTEFTASFIYHHAIGDGVSGLAFHNAFRNALEAASASPLADFKAEETVVPSEDTSLLPPLGQLHPLPINPSPPSPPATNLQEWTGNSIDAPCTSRWASICLSPSVSKAFFQECKEKNLSVTSALSSIVATVLFGILPPTVEALTCIIPVSLRPWLKLPRGVVNDAIGTYFDATRVQFTRPEQNFPNPGSTDIWSGAEKASKSINDYLSNVSPSGEPYTSVAVFETIPDISAALVSMFGKPRDAAFEVTNVGVFSSPTIRKANEDTPLWEVEKVLISRSSIATGAAVTVSVATGGNGAMAIGFSWQDGVLTEDVMEHVIQGVKKYFEKY
ncbi:hypothetical protein ARAM_003775 [Aspergillus rambellii]|uniref:Alcohol acetyltransferase n=3 Tax=Aspergillus subgen. Nidulantes TaxID=2720870 RepID=A0A0F8XMF1_9EURO|nr:hypothetical protein ARAM_003775 [Aspergillus rambellii]